MAFGKRFYVVTLVAVLQRAHKYGTRYQQQLSTGLSPAQYACLVSTLQAIADCLALIHPPAPEP